MTSSWSPRYREAPKEGGRNHVLPTTVTNCLTRKRLLLRTMRDRKVAVAVRMIKIPRIRQLVSQRLNLRLYFMSTFIAVQGLDIIMVNQNHCQVSKSTAQFSPGLGADYIPDWPLLAKHSCISRCKQDLLSYLKVTIHMVNGPC